MHVRYNLLQSHLIRWNRQGVDNFTNSAENGPLDVLVAVGNSGSQDHQIPLAVLSPDRSLIQSKKTYHVVSRTHEGAYSLDTVSNAVGGAPHCCTSQAAGVSNTQSAAVHHRRLSLRGRSHNFISLSSHAAATAAVGAAAYPPAWQLQQQCLIPACKGLQLLPGKVTWCCLLVADTQIQQQQREELQQLLQQAGAVWLNSSSSSSSGEEVFEVLAAAAAAVAVRSTADDCSSYQPQLGAIQCGPVVCSSSLYNVIASALAANSTATNSNTPPCMFLAATTSGQVWVCDPTLALLGSSGSSSDGSGCPNGLAGSDTAWQLQQQQHKEMRQQSAPVRSAQRTGLRLLLDLQQPVIALLPISCPVAHPSSSSGRDCEAADAFLFVGSLGRVGLLHLQQGPQSGTVSDTTVGAAAAEPAAAAGDQDGGGHLTQQLSMLHQQLPFAVQAAAVASCLAQPQQQQQQQQGQQQQGQRQQQQQPSSGMALLLLSGSGSVYVADLAAPYTAAAVGGAAAAMPSSSSSKGLQLQPQKLEVPGPIGKLGVLHPQQQQRQQQQQGIHSNAGGFPAGNAQKATNSSSSSSIVILQLQGSDQLLQLILDHNITQQPQQQQQQGSGQADTMLPSDRYNVTISSSNVAAAAAAARSKLQGLMSALEILSTARDSLELGTAQQDEYLMSVGKDLELLRGLKSWGRSPTQPAVPAVPGSNLGHSTVPTGGIALKHTATAAQQQQQVKFTCDIRGLWPAPAAAAAGSTSCSSSMHMAVTIHLQANSSSSSSGGGLHQVGFSAGWQLLVTFTRESARTPTWQTTVPLSLHSCHGPNPKPSLRDRVKPFGPYNWPNNSSSDCSSSKGSKGSETGYVCASLLLPLPEQCIDLSEGGWLQVHAVKPAPGGLHLQLTSAAAAAEADSSSALPAVALLSQQYVSVLQLSSMLATNPAAAVLSAPATAAAAAAAATGSSGPSRPYSCILQLQAVQGPHAAVVQQLQPSSHKRSRADLNGVVSLQQCQQQPRASSSTNQQQQQKTPLGTTLGNWLESIAVAPSHGLAQHSSSSSNLSLPGQGTQLALLRGQVSYNLGQGAHGQLTWASGPLIPPQQQQQQQATTAPSTTAAAAAASLDDGTVYSNIGRPRLPVQVAIQSSTVTGWAQMHRSFVIAVLRQLQNASTGADGITAQDISTMHRGDNSSTTTNSRWCIEAQKQQLQKALHQVTQLHQQLMGLQAMAEKAVDLRAQLLAAFDAATGSNESCIKVQNLVHQEKSKQLSSGQLLEQLGGVLSSWESRLCAGYGRAVLAASTASCLLCYED